ncbi:acyl carrier protein [Actinomadura fibrosa]|uniref:Acyl carrier protein n=1 Tax=Actinomadura fibrosa TaxID=111802 RepID=A0ABW2XRP6_9ACTN|nr:acyl carrier protein [Actinomadura fibrosa]
MSDVMAEVVLMLTEVVGEDFLLDVEVGPATTFGDDLALESIEFVALVDRLRGHYGDRVDFPRFIAALDLDQIMNLTVGDVVGHIESAIREEAHA